MLTREQVVESLRLRSAYLAEEFGVRRIGLFGSFAKGLSTDKSDVDLIIEFDPPIGLRFMELGDYLEEVLGRRVDILTPVGLQAIRQKTVREDITESIVYV
jgi:predicted nucleotidyltransferase